MCSSIFIGGVALGGRPLFRFMGTKHKANITSAPVCKANVALDSSKLSGDLIKDLNWLDELGWRRLSKQSYGILRLTLDAFFVRFSGFVNRFIYRKGGDGDVWQYLLRRVFCWEVAMTTAGRLMYLPTLHTTHTVDYLMSVHLSKWQTKNISWQNNSKKMKF